MSEGIDEAALPVDTPGSVMISDSVAASERAGSDGFGNEGIGIVEEDFDSNGCLANCRRTRESVIRGFVKKVLRTSDVQTND
jgi:hypothetical protein